MNINYLKKLYKKEKVETDIWVNEALFGYGQIIEHIENLDHRSSILEVGCGSGILLSMFSSRFKKLYFQGIEPFGDGFSSISKLNQFIKKQGVNILNVGYEDFKPKKKYDLIYCVNVFEHLKDWKFFIQSIELWLKKNGRLIILCPNYGFPYESHFGIPVIFNKKTTYLLFRSHIDRYEVNNSVKGLWHSLNFVTKKKLVNFVKKNSSLVLIDDMSIMDTMLNRLTDDIEFSRRHKILGRTAIFFLKIGFFNILYLFPNKMPYMKIQIIK